MSGQGTLVDGVESSRIEIADRGLQYGDGLFETMSCRDGRVRWLELHLARLQLGCERLGIVMPERATLQRELAALAAGSGRCLLKLIVTRGVAQGRGYRPGGAEQPTRILTRYAWPAAPAAEFHAHCSPVPLGGNPALAGIKHLNRLEQVLAQRAAAQAGVDEALQCGPDGDIVSATMSNVFIVRGKLWLTPPIARGGVAGVMRSLVLRTAPGLGLTVREARLTRADAAAASAIVLSNVRLGLQAVHCYEGRRLSVPASLPILWEAIDGAAS